MDRISYGIDLGTTNSVIARVQRGKPVVVKSGFQGDTTPSAVAFGRRGRIRIGQLAYNRLHADRLRALKHDREERNVFVEFKRTMGTDHRYVPALDPSVRFSSEELSAEVLKELRRYVTNDEVRAAIVTIPAAFTVPQQQATLRAAEMAGIRQCHLLQEPVAAAMAYGLDTEHGNEKWLVFDLGGGTFDAALVLVEAAEITVKDTEGDNHLGGKDLDYAVEDIILEEITGEFDIREYVAGSPHRDRMLRDALKHWAEEANTSLSFRESHWVLTELDRPVVLPDGREIELDFEITVDRLRPFVAPIFQRAIDKAKVLLARHGLSGSDLDDLILVGGPTYSPILREMVASQLRQPNTSTSVDPMTVVAKGAALYASTIPLKVARTSAPRTSNDTADGVLHLEVGYEATSISHEEFVTIKCRDPSDLSRLGPLSAELHRTGTGFSSGRHPLSERGILLEVKLEENRGNVFDLEVTTARGDRIESIPSEITIIQGTRVTGSPLPNSLGVAVLGTSDRSAVFLPLKGAEKSKPMPVTGFKPGLKTPERIRPGVSEGELWIDIFEGGANAKGKRLPFCGAHVRTCKLTGDQVRREIPPGTTFDLTVVTQDSSSVPELVRVSFPSLDDDEYELRIPSDGKELRTEWIDHELSDARRLMQRMRRAGHVDHGPLGAIETRLGEEAGRLRHAGTDRDAAEQAVSRLKEAFRELYDLAETIEWPEAEAELDEAWAELKRANAEEGHTESRDEMRDLEHRRDQVRRSGNTDDAREVTDQIRRAIFQLKYCEWSKGILNWARGEFSRIRWTNPGQARLTVNEGMQAMLAGRPCPELLDHARRVLELVAQESEEIPPYPLLADRPGQR